MYKHLSLTFVLLFVIFGANAQNRALMNCGTNTTSTDIERLKSNKAKTHLVNNRSSEIRYIPIQFHLVGSDNGGGRISPYQVFDGLCKLNEDFLPLNLQFYFNGNFNFIDNSAMYEMEYPNIPQAVRTLFSLNRVSGNVNIFIGNGLSSGNSGFYTGSTDIIYMDKRYVNSRDVILAHELGHFFSLPHTFFGWENTEYNPDEPTPTQVFRGDIAYDVEYVDRERNCEEAGDFFCGTPADYITNWNGACDYTGGAVDPDSVLIDPDETNIMSYYSFTGCEQFIFSQDQSDAMFADFDSRSEFLGTNITKQEAVVSDVVLNSPADGEEIGVNEIELSWDPVENATLYFVEVSRIPNFFALDAQILTKDLSVVVEDLDIDKNYYWRVVAFNETNFCETAMSPANSFRTSENSSSINDWESSQGFRIYPNPARTSEVLSLFSSQPVKNCQIKIFNANGGLVADFRKEIIEGINQLNELSNISKGLYFTLIAGRKELTMIKVIVQ